MCRGARPCPLTERIGPVICGSSVRSDRSLVGQVQCSFSPRGACRSHEMGRSSGAGEKQDTHDYRPVAPMELPPHHSSEFFRIFFIYAHLCFFSISEKGMI